MNVKVDFSIKREPKWFWVKWNIRVFVATHPARGPRSNIGHSVIVHVLDAVVSLVHILIDISDNRNKFIMGTTGFSWQGPDRKIYVLSLSRDYRGSKRLWGSPHQVDWALFDFTFFAILKFSFLHSKEKYVKSKINF